MIFKNREDAGEKLAEKLQKYKSAKNTLVLGLARGGVVVAHAVSRVLHLPLNVVVVRKIGSPGNEELAIGAIAENGEGIFNENLIALLGVTSDYLNREIENQKRLAKLRAEKYCGSCLKPHVKGKIIILIDDGIATGASIKVAIKSLKAEFPEKIVLAVPVAPPDTLRALQSEVGETICLYTPTFFEAVGAFYQDFPQISDDEIIALLKH